MPENSPEPRYTKYEPVMFDTAPFGNIFLFLYQVPGSRSTFFAYLPLLANLPLLAIDKIIEV